MCSLETARISHGMQRSLESGGLWGRVSWCSPAGIGVLLWYLHTGPALLSAAHHLSAIKTKCKAMAHQWLIINVQICPKEMANCIITTVAFTGQEGKKVGGPRPTLPLNKRQMLYKWRQSSNHCSLAFLGSSALNLFHFYCGDFGSLECAAVPALGWCVLAPVLSLPQGNWEFFITLLCCRLGNLSEFPCCFLCVAPCFPGGEWLGGLVPVCPGRACCC